MGSVAFKIRAVHAGLYVTMVGSQAISIGRRVVPVLLRELERRDVSPEDAKLLVPDDCKDGIGWASGETVRLGSAFIASLLHDDRNRS